MSGSRKVGSGRLRREKSEFKASLDSSQGYTVHRDRYNGVYVY